ncbi:MAG: oligosaccharide flippase family protein [Lachnospiraceae bacterium]|nr:oligosaccharide flippase family protein [Lachnospiraceae bacterium]
MSNSKGKELAKNTAIISFGKMCTQLVSFLLMPMYTAILSTEEYGVVDLVVTYGQLLLPLVTIQMEQTLFRFLIDKRSDEDGKKKVVSDVISLTIYIMIAFSIIYMCISPLIKSEFKFHLLLSLFASVMSAMMLQSARGLGKNMVYAAGSFIAASGQVILNIIFIAVLRLGASGMIFAMVISQCICAIFVACKIEFIKYFRFKLLNKNDIREYLGYSAPLVPNAISWWILNASDRSIILRFLGVGFNGIYSAANKFSGIYTTIYNIFNLSWTESVSLHLKDNNSSEEFSKLQSTIVRLCISASLGLISIMPFFFKILVNEKFDDAYYQIPLLTIGAFFSSMVGLVSAYYIADKKTAVIARTSMLCAAINIVVNLLLISHIGIYAASVSTVVAYALLYILRYFDVKKRFGIQLENTLILSGFVMMIFTTVAYYTRNIVICGVSFIIYTIYALIINREFIGTILKTFKQKVIKK